eukprot:754082-Hanusia_phi.AAC.1
MTISAARLIPILLLPFIARMQVQLQMPVAPRPTLPAPSYRACWTAAGGDIAPSKARWPSRTRVVGSGGSACQDVGERGRLT